MRVVVFGGTGYLGGAVGEPPATTTLGWNPVYLDAERVVAEEGA